MIWDSAGLAFLTSRAPKEVQWLIWVTAADLVTGAPVSIGLWTGADHQSFTIGGVARTYYGAQGALQIPPISYAAGTEITSMEVSLSVSSEADALVRGYNTRFKPVEIHCALFNPATGALVSIARAFTGTIDGSPISTPVKNGVGSIGLRLMSSARRGTMTSNARKSDASQRLRLSTDTFRLHGDLGAVASDTWGAGDMQPSGIPGSGGPFGTGGGGTGGGAVGGGGGGFGVPASGGTGPSTGGNVGGRFS
jgi:hypothetical protein